MHRADHDTMSPAGGSLHVCLQRWSSVVAFDLETFADMRTQRALRCAAAWRSGCERQLRCATGSPRATVFVPQPAAEPRSRVARGLFDCERTERVRNSVECDEPARPLDHWEAPLSAERRHDSDLDPFALLRNLAVWLRSPRAPRPRASRLTFGSLKISDRLEVCRRSGSACRRAQLQWSQSASRMVATP